MNFYAVLGVSPDASEQKIRSAYRALARRFHPDRGPGSSSGKFQEMVEAYETLSDPGRRQAYDLSLSRRRPAISRAEPMRASPEPILQARFQAYGNPLRSSSRMDDLMEELFYWGDDFLWGPFPFRW